MPESPLRVSYSALNTYQTCQRKYYWEYVRKILPAGRRHALEFGSAWHEGLSAYYKTRSLQPALDTFNAHYDDGEDSVRTRVTAKRMLERYATKYPLEGPELTLVADEQWLELPVAAGRGLYVMKIDKLVLWHDEPNIMEHKTTSGFQGITAGHLKKYKPNLQLAGYIKGVQELVDVFYKKVLVDIAWVGRGEPKSGEPFLRYNEHVEDWELREFDQIVGQLVQQLADRRPHEDQIDTYTPNWGACTQFGECAYRRLCISAPSIRESEIAAGYIPKPPREDVTDAVV